MENIAPFIPGFSRTGLNEQQILEQTKRVLCGGDPHDLLILDNADDAVESVDELRRKLSSIPMRILVTTRAGSSSAVSVERMDHERLHAMFRNHRAGISEPEMDELIDAVDGHTLTVDLMARLLYRKQEANTCQALRDALRNRDLENADLSPITSSYYGDEGQARINEHLKAVFRVAKLDAAEQMLLRFASLLPECGLDADIFVNAAVQKKQEKKRRFLARFFRKQEEPQLLDNPKEVGKVLQALSDGGWLKRELGILKIHPVIRIVCRDELKQAQGSCHSFVGRVWERYDKTTYDYARFRQLAQLLTNASETLGDPDRWYNYQAGSLWNQLGDAQRALQCNLRDMELREQSQSNPRDLAVAYNNVGNIYCDLGDYAEALEFCQKALAIHQNALAILEKAPAIHEKDLQLVYHELATTYSNIGETYSQLGDYDSAMEYQQKALEIQEYKLLSEHPNLAKFYNNVGATYGALGDLETELECHLKALEIFENSPLTDDPALATAYDNVGAACGKLNDHGQALEYHQKALEIREKVLPPEHPELATSYDNVGFVCGILGDYAKALEYQQKALEIRENVLPPEHPNLATSYNNMGYTYHSMGEHARALECSLKALQIREKVLPPEHPSLATSYNNVGSTYDNLDDYAKALEYKLKALAIQERTLPENHPHNAMCCSNIAWTYYNMGQYETALKFMRRAADIADQSLPEGHPNRVSYRSWAEDIEREIGEGRASE